LKRCINILLQNVPAGIDVQSIKSELLNIPEVINVHDFHVWQLNDNINIATLHYLIKMNSRNDRDLKITNIIDLKITNIIDLKIKNILHKYNIHSSTLQVELVEDSNEKQNCNEITCDNDNCEKNKCC